MSEKGMGFEGHGEKRQPSPPPKYDDSQLLHYPPPQHGDGYSTPPHLANQHAPPQLGGGFSHPAHQLNQYPPPQLGAGFSNPAHQLNQYPPQHGDGFPNAPLLTAQPPTPVTNVTINAAPPAAQQPVIINNVVGGGMVACSKCGSNVAFVKMENSWKTHCCCLLCCFTLPFCFFLPYCCDWCQKPVQRCGACKSKLG